VAPDVIKESDRPTCEREDGALLITGRTDHDDAVAHAYGHDVDASLAFHSDKLGFKKDLRLQDDSGKTFLGSVQVGDIVIMFDLIIARQTRT